MNAPPEQCFAKVTLTAWVTTAPADRLVRAHPTLVAAGIHILVPDAAGAEAEENYDLHTEERRDSTEARPVPHAGGHGFNPIRGGRSP